MPVSSLNMTPYLAGFHFQGKSQHIQRSHQIEGGLRRLVEIICVLRNKHHMVNPYKLDQPRSSFITRARSLDQTTHAMFTPFTIRL